MKNETVEKEFGKFASWSRGKSELYETLCSTVVENEDLHELVGKIEADNRPYVFFAAIHFLVLEEPKCPLAEFYPSISRNPKDPGKEALEKIFREFCTENFKRIKELAESRKVQTNEVRRCAVLLPGIAYTDARTEEPLSLIELGSSAGLNLLWDKYRYLYSEQDLGSNSALKLECDPVEGNLSIPDSMPQIEERIGVDINPLDVTSSDDKRWLKALTWPEHVERRKRLEKAIDVARSQPPEIVKGDICEELPEIVTGLTDPVLVYCTQVLWALPPEKIEEFLEVIEEISRDREIYFLFGERGGIEWITGERDVDEEPEVWLEWSDNPSEGFQKLGSYDVHGEWLKWNK